MAFLTGLRPYRNFLNPESLQEVVRYVCERLEPFGYDAPIFQRWTPNAVDTEYTNIILQYNPGKSSKVVIGAHYDVCGEQPGADDNGSAVVGLLETARLLAERRPALNYTVEMVWFCLEEPPFFGSHEMGSYIHAESCSRDEEVKTMAMINYEMIGYFSSEPGSQQIPGEYAELSSLIGDVGDFICVVGIDQHHDLIHFMSQAMQQETRIRTHPVAFRSPYSFAGLSDHANYWKFGIPAVMINNTAMLRNPHYHEHTDDYGTIDFARMAAVVQAAWHGIIGFQA